MRMAATHRITTLTNDQPARDASGEYRRLKRPRRDDDREKTHRFRKASHGSEVGKVTGFEVVRRIRGYKKKDFVRLRFQID